jgi:O-antigen ligase
MTQEGINPRERPFCHNQRFEPDEQPREANAVTFFMVHRRSSARSAATRNKNEMVLKSFVALAIASLLLGASLFQYTRRRSAATRLVLLACACFVLVATTHVFEALDLLPEAGWGQPRSVGHYIDLIAAWLGVTLVLAGASVHLARCKNA